jgi:autotransporter translocation and assembly factor TamB
MKTQNTKKTKYIFKRIFLWIFRIAILILGLVILFGIYLTTAPGEDFLRSRAENELHKILNQNVKIDQLETNLVSSLQINNMNISQTKDDSIIHFVKLKELKVHYNFWKLIFQNISIHSILIDSLQIYVLKDNSGFINLPITASSSEETASTPEESAAFDLILGSLVLKNSTFYYNDKSIPVSGTLRYFKFQLENKQLNNYSFSAQSYHCDVFYSNTAIPVDKIEIDGDFIDKKLSIRSSLIKLPGYELSGIASIDMAQTPAALAGHCQLTGSPQKLSEIFKQYLPNQLYPVKGEMNFSVELGGDIDNPNISAQVIFPNLLLSDIALKEGKIEAAWQNDEIQLRRFNLRILQGSIFGTGQLIMGDVIWHSMDFNISNIDLNQTWKAVYNEESPYHGKINGQINSSGFIENPDSSKLLANITLKKMSFKQKPLPDFIVDASFKNGIANLDIHQAESEITANVKFTDEELRGNFKINIVRLEPIAGIFNFLGLEGFVKVNGNLYGTMNSPKATASFSGGKIRYQNLPLDTIAGSFSYADRQIHVNELIFQGELSEIDSTNPPFNLSGLRGGFSYRGQLQGSPEDPTGDLSLHFKNLGYENYQLDSLSLKLSTSNKIVSLDKFNLNLDSTAIVMMGDYSLRKLRGDFKIRTYKTGIIENQKERDFPIIAAIDLSDTNQIKLNVDCQSFDIGLISKFIPQINDASGDLNLNLSFKGTSKNPNADLRFSINNPRFEKVAMDSIRGQIQLKSNYLYLRKLELSDKGNHSWIEGKVQLRKPGEKGFAITEDNSIDLTAEADGIDLRIFNPLFGLGTEIAGTSSYRFEVEGSLNNPKINGELDISAGEFRIDKDSLPITGINVDLELKDSLLIINQFKGQLQKTPLSLKGKIMANRDMRFASDLQLSILNKEVLQGIGTITKDNMDFDLSINRLDLSLFQPLLMEVKNLTGIVNSNIKIEGSFSEPDIQGNLRISELSFQPSVLNTSLSNGVVKINFRGNQVQLDTLHLQLNGGSIYSSGSFAIQDKVFTQLDFQTRIYHVKIDKPDEYLVTINSAQIFYKKQNRQYMLDGDIVLGETKLLSNFKPQAILPFTKKVERPAQTPTPLMKQTRINVRVRDSKNIWIDNNLAHIQLHSEVGVIGNLAQPNMAGRISVEEGYLLYLDRKFQMEQGTIDFIDLDRLNPIVDLEAKTSVTTYERLEAATYDINLKITGELDQAKVELTSDPPLERSDIIALLTVGATRKQLTGKSSSGQDVSTSQILEQRIQTLSSKIISGYAGKTLERLFGFEDVNIQGNIFRANKGTGPQLIASKRINDSAKLTYTTTVGHLNEQGIRLDYRLSKRFSFEGQTNQQGESSLSIKYNLKFK